MARVRTFPASCRDCSIRARSFSESAAQVAEETPELKGGLFDKGWFRVTERFLVRWYLATRKSRSNQQLRVMDPMQLDRSHSKGWALPAPGRLVPSRRPVRQALSARP